MHVLRRFLKRFKRSLDVIPLSVPVPWAEAARLLSDVATRLLAQDRWAGIDIDQPRAKDAIMNQHPSDNLLPSRRDFIKRTGTIAAASALAGAAIPYVH